MKKKYSTGWPAGHDRGPRTRQRLIEAAAEVFSELGFGAASTRVIVQNAQTNLVSIPYYFGSKLGLYDVEIANFRFHDLRHTAASWMRMHGADIQTVAQIPGHKDLRMAARYSHLSPAYLLDAVKLLDSAFAEKPRKARTRGKKGDSSGSVVTVASPDKASASRTAS